MSQKARRILGIYAAAAIAMLTVYSCVSHVRLENYRLIAKYSSQRAFEETAASVQELSEALGKGVYAVDAGMCAQVCSDIQAAAQSAEAAMATLPFTTQELSRTAGFLGTAGDYAMSLARQDGEFTGEQRETLRSLSDKASEFSALLQELRGSINDGEVMIDRQERRLQNVGEDGGVTLSARLTEYEGDFEMPDLPEYEGRYTASETARSGDMSDEEMLSAAASVAGVEPEELKKEYGYEGESRLRCYSAGTKYILVSSAGVKSLTDSRLVEEAQMDMEQARQLAEEFLAANGYENLKLSAEEQNGAVARFEYICTDGEADCLDSGLSVAIALDTGEVYAFDAEDYSDADMEDGQWQISEEDARAKLPSGLEAESCRKVVIDSVGGRPTACYELVCTDGVRRVTIYLNASDGVQQEIKVERTGET